MIRFENVSFAHAKGKKVFAGLTFALPDGENLSVVGPSGSGKSTLLHLLLGLHRPAGGRVVFDGEEITGPARERMIVFQNHGLLPWLTALGNVRFSLETAPAPPADLDGTARGFLAKVGLAEFAGYYPKELSGGMQQRLGIARALAASPRLLLLDEPFSSLDVIRRRGIFADMSELIRRERKTAVLVTHDVDEALRFAAHVLILGGKEAIFGESAKFKEEDVYALWQT